MQMATDRGGKRPWWRSRWWMPLFSVFLGTAVLVAFWVGGSPREGLYGFAVMGGLGLVFLFGSRNETIRGLGGPGREERWAHIDILATAVSGLVLITLIIALWLNDIAHGGDGNPYGGLAAVAGVAYLVSVLWLRFRA